MKQGCRKWWQSVFQNPGLGGYFRVPRSSVEVVSSSKLYMWLLSLGRLEDPGKKRGCHDQNQDTQLSGKGSYSF